MLRFADKSIPAPLAENEGELLVDLFLQRFGIGVLDVLQQLVQGGPAFLPGFDDHPVKIGIDLNLRKIDKAPLGKPDAASTAVSFFHSFPFSVSVRVRAQAPC